MIKNKKGFTLIELSVVLVIIGIIFGFGIYKTLSNMAKTQKSSVEQKALSELMEAVIQFASVQDPKRLPTKAEFDELSSEYSSKYTIDYIFTDLPICSSTTTGRSLTKCLSDDCKSNEVLNNLALSIFMSGPSRKIQTITGANPIVLGAKGTIDDEADSISLKDLQVRIKCFDKSLRIVNDSLPAIYSNGANFNNIRVVAENGAKDYTWEVVEQEGATSVLGANKLKVTEVDNVYEISLNDGSAALTPGNYLLTFKVKDNSKPQMSAEKALVLTVRDNFVHQVADIDPPVKPFIPYKCIVVDTDCVVPAGTIACSSSENKDTYCLNGGTYISGRDLCDGKMPDWSIFKPVKCGPLDNLSGCIERCFPYIH